MCSVNTLKAGITFEELKDKDEKSAKEIDMQMRKIQSLTVKFFF